VNEEEKPIPNVDYFFIALLLSCSFNLEAQSLIHQPDVSDHGKILHEFMLFL